MFGCVMRCRWRSTWRRSTTATSPASASGSRGGWQGRRGPFGVSNPFDTWPEEIKQYWVYDPEGAERLLDEAGYPRGADGVRFRTEILLRPSHDVGYRELIAGYWKEIGVEAEIKTGRRRDLQRADLRRIRRIVATKRWR